MLSVSSYPQPNVDGCREKADRQISAYQDLENVAKGHELEAFEPLLFNSMVMVLDNYFLHHRAGSSHICRRVAAGDEIRLNVEDFQALSKAFFAEIERKYP